jgi:DNA-binding MarR family transcriptional regulator
MRGMDDRVDKQLGQWSRERPDLDCTGLGVVARVQILAKLLESRRLVAREPDPSDRRGVLVVLTEAGKELIDDAIDARLAAADGQLSMLDFDERLTISKGLRKVMRGR